MADVTGTNGNDTLEGTVRRDRLFGLGGSDLLLGSLGADEMNGGSAVDTVRYEDPVIGTLLVDLVSGGSGGQAGGDTYVSVENIEYRGDKNASLFGNSLGNRIEGGFGDDLIRGREGADRLQGDQGGYNFSTFGNDTLEGGAGDDTLFGDFGNDTLDGGTGIDTADYTFANHSLDIDLAANPQQAVEIGTAVGASFTDRLLGIEHVEGGKKADEIVGSVANNRLDGNGGDDILDGFFGNDVLLGGDGNDRLAGGAGGDTLIAGIGSDVLAGGSGNDLMIGEAGNDVYEYSRLFFNGTFFPAGNDVIQDVSIALPPGGSGGGTDRLVMALSDIATIVQDGDDLVITGRAGTGTTIRIVDHFGGGTVEEFQNIDTGGGVVTLSTSLVGGGAPGIIAGTDKGETLDGKGGDDFLFGNGGGDLIVGGEGDDAIEGGSGADLLRGGRGDDALEGGSDSDLLRGGRGDDRMDGGRGDDLLHGGQGRDTLFGSRGVDLLIGGGGRDTFAFARSDTSTPGASDVIQGFAQGKDVVDFSALPGGLDFVGAADFSGKGQVRFVAAGADTLLQLNLDGNEATVELEVLVTDRIVFEAGDFLL